MGDDAFPTYTRAEELADAIVHAIGVTAGAIAAIILVIIALAQLPTDAATAVVIYALGMLAMFCFSAAYNLSRGPKRWLLRRCDHAAIFIKIAATYTPFAVAKMGGTVGLVLLAAVWGIALAGAAAKLIAPHRVAGMSTLKGGCAC
jgi:hemolysin III